MASLTIGQRIRIGAHVTHNQSQDLVGLNGTVTHPGSGPSSTCTVSVDGVGACNFYVRDILTALMTKEEYQIEASGLKERLAEIQYRLKYMEESGKAEVSDEEIKAFRTLKVMEEEGLETHERAARIAAVFMK